METVALIVGLVDPLCTRLQRLAVRLKQVSSAPETFHVIQDNLDDCLAKLRSVQALRLRNENSLSLDSRDVFRRDARRCLRLLRRLITLSTELEDILPRRRSNRLRIRAILFIIRFLRAHTIAGVLDEMTTCVDEMHAVSSNLAAVFTAVENTGALHCDFAGLRNVIHENRVQISNTKQSIDLTQWTLLRFIVDSNEFRPNYFLPTLHRNTVLDFESLYQAWRTPEAVLKHWLVECIRCRELRGNSSTMAINGESGVGKTIAMISVGCEKDIQVQFRHGVYFLSIGKEAQHSDFIDQLVKIVRLSGGHRAAKLLNTARNIEEAVELAAHWLEGKSILFLVDDVWDIDGGKYVQRFRRLMRMCKCSCLLYTTRKGNVADQADEKMMFHSRRNDDTVARDIFLKHAGLSMADLAERSREKVELVLHQCVGVPVIMAMAGSSLRLLQLSIRKWEQAVERLTERMTQCKVKHCNEDLAHMRTVIHTCVRLTDEWIHNYLSGRGHVIVKCETLLLRLCSMKRQAMVTMGQLRVLWDELEGEEVEEIVKQLSELGLVQMREHKGSGLVFGIHGLVYEQLQEDS